MGWKVGNFYEFHLQCKKQFSPKQKRLEACKTWKIQYVRSIIRLGFISSKLVTMFNETATSGDDTIPIFLLPKYM